MKQAVVLGELLDETLDYSLADLCRTCGVPAEIVIAMVAEGIVEPQGTHPREWRFSGICVTRVHTAIRLQRDLGVNLPGAALALELLEELEQLRVRI